jgi:putative membrane protein
MIFQKNKSIYLYSFFFWFGFITSGISPFDYFTWILEVFPAVIVFIVIVLTRKKFPLSNLLYVLILIHAYVLFVGGHYTYAEVPLFDMIREAFNQQRNNYDKVGHFMQGFVPAIAAREILIRDRIVNSKKWLSFIIVCICVAISAFYELLEAAVALLTGDSAEAFLGTQGYVWDTQSDMFYASIGAILALVLLSRLHNRSMNAISGLSK